MKQSIKKALYLTAGVILLVLASIGIVVPILPTTPLLLLASYCFLRSSERLYHWLINHRILGRYIRNYLIYKAVDKRSKIFALIILWTGVILSMYLVNKTLVYIILTTIATGVTIHILRLRTLTAEQEEALCRQNEASPQLSSKTIKVKS